VKPVGCPEKKPFMVVHDDGVAATANPETATFPDSCQVTLNWPDAELLNKKQGVIVGVRDPVSNQYSVQLQDENVIKAWGSSIVKVAEGQIKWRVSGNAPTPSDEEYPKQKGSKLPARPSFDPVKPSDSTTQKSATIPSFVSPSTAAQEGGYSRSQDTPAISSPPSQRKLLASSNSR
jgi:hypothetical protein